MKQILLPTDFSENSKKAIRYAIDLFGDHEVKYTLLNTFEIISSRAQMASASLRAEMEVQADEELKGLKEELKLNYPEISFKLRSHYGSLVDVLDSLSNRDYDVVVMGTKGASGLKEVFLGSNTWDAIENCNVPVIAVPNEAKKTQIKSILIALDGEKFSSLDKFDLLKNLAIKHQSQLTLLRVGSEESIDTEQQRQINTVFAGLNTSFAWMNNENIAKGIKSYAEACNCDILVVVNRKKTFWENLFHSSVSKKLTFKSTIPLMALKD